MKIIYSLIFIFIIINPLSSQNLYWINKNGGDFHDPLNWSKDSGGSGGGGEPDSDKVLVFDENSGMDLNNVVTFVPGTHQVNSIIVIGDSPFIFQFLGTNSSSDVDIEVYGDLIIETPGMKMVYNSSDPNTNTWWFLGSSTIHDIDTRGLNMNDIIMNGSSSFFNQQSSLIAETRIRLEQGTWNTGGNEVETDGIIRFRNNGGSSSALPKVFNTNGSTIRCKHFDALLAYDMVVSGSHTIYVEEFEGNPQNVQPAGQYDRIHLLDFEPPLFGSLNGINHFFINNLECEGCTINSVILEDENITKIRKGVTIKNMTIQNVNSEILINGSNCSGLCDNYITIDGTITGPAEGPCGARASIKPLATNLMAVRTGSMNAHIIRVDLKGLPTEGPGTFTLTSGITSGGSTGWTLSNPVPPQVFKWGSNPINSEWDDWKNWDGPEGCAPTINDDVYIDDASSSGTIALPIDGHAECRNLYWIKSNGVVEMHMNSNLKINGNVYVEKFATFSGSEAFELVGQGDVEISSISLLPRIEFVADGTNFNLSEDLRAHSLYFNGGNFITNSQDIEASSWEIPESTTHTPSNYYLGASTIDITGEIKFAKTDGDNHILDAGTSHILCGAFSSLDQYNFYDVTLRNAFTFSFDVRPYTFHKLIIDGAKVNITDHLEVDELIFNDDGTQVEVGINRNITINESITSLASSTDPASLKTASQGRKVDLTKPEGNLCISGHIELLSINAIAGGYTILNQNGGIHTNIPGVVHAPDGINLGDNDGIYFTPISTDPSQPLFWVGNTSTNWTTHSNWSTLSGGCSTDYNPNNRPKLVFNQHSFFNSDRVVINASVITNHIEFNNLRIPSLGGAYIPFIMENQVNLTLNEMTVSESRILIDDKEVTVNGTITVEDGSVLDIEADEINADSWIFPVGVGSLIVVRDGSIMRQKSN